MIDISGLSYGECVLLKAQLEEHLDHLSGTMTRAEMVAERQRVDVDMGRAIQRFHHVRGLILEACQKFINMKATSENVEALRRRVFDALRGLYGSSWDVVAWCVPEGGAVEQEPWHPKGHGFSVQVKVYRDGKEVEGPRDFLGEGPL